MSNSPVRQWAALLSVLGLIASQASFAQCENPVGLDDIWDELDIGFTVDPAAPQPDIMLAAQGIPTRGFISMDVGEVGTVQCESDHFLTYLWIGGSPFGAPTPEERIQKVWNLRARLSQFDLFIDGLPVTAEFIETEPEDGFDPREGREGDPMANMFVGWISEPYSLAPGFHEVRMEFFLDTTFISGSVNFEVLDIFDFDGDGIANGVDTTPSIFSADFSDGTTSGTITDRGDQTLFISDEPDPAGVRVTAFLGGEPAAATVSACGGTASLTFSAGDESVVTCTSIQVLVIEGEVEMEVEVNGETAIVSIPANNVLTFVPETATFSAPETNPDTILIIVGGAEVPVVPGQTVEDIVLVEIDIKPGSDPNCVNINGHGVIPVAILGSELFDVSDIYQDNLSFGGLEVRTRGKKGPLCGLEDINGDGFSDLVCHFEDDTSHWIVGSSAATLIGERSDGTSFAGTDSICMVP